MLSLIKYSVSDILTTGDQSITDVIDCCSNKTIWYQVVPWKKTFAKQLAKELPQPFIASTKTACGTLKAIHWDSKETDIKKRYDFRKLAKHKLDSIFAAVAEYKVEGSVVNRYIEDVKNKKWDW
jgi:hypothetical protein